MELNGLLLKFPFQVKMRTVVKTIVEMKTVLEMTAFVEMKTSLEIDICGCCVFEQDKGSHEACPAVADQNPTEQLQAVESEYSDLQF